MSATKGTIFNIQRFSVHDGPGIRTIVFMKGCPLFCEWCANPESQKKQKQVMYAKQDCRGCGTCERVCPMGAVAFQSGKGVRILEEKCRTCGTCVEECIPMALKMVGEDTDVDTVAKEVMKDSVFFRKGGGVTVSGGEPLVQEEFVLELLKYFRERHIHTAIETCGQVSYESIDKVRPYCNLFLFDIKEMNSAKHKEFTGVGNEQILKNLLRLGQTDAEIWIRMPMIQGMNDSREDVLQVVEIAEQIHNLTRIELLPYHNLGVSKYERLGRKYGLDRELQPPSQEWLYELKEGIEQKLNKSGCEVVVGK